jgi:hypothetical protein
MAMSGALSEPVLASTGTALTGRDAVGAAGAGQPVRR